jgi:hypothetical protein
VSIAKTVRNAVRDAINAIPYVDGLGIVAEAIWMPNVERSATKPMQIQVAPSERITTIEARRSTKTDITCDVGIFLGLTTDNQEAQGEQVQLMVDAIVEGLLMQTIGDRYIAEAEQVMIFSADHWRRLNMATSFIKFTLR